MSHLQRDGGHSSEENHCARDDDGHLRQLGLALPHDGDLLSVGPVVLFEVGQGLRAPERHANVVNAMTAAAMLSPPNLNKV